jgi:hypothetical protein
MGDGLRPRRVSLRAALLPELCKNFPKRGKYLFRPGFTVNEFQQSFDTGHIHAALLNRSFSVLLKKHTPLPAPWQVSMTLIWRADMGRFSETDFSS